MYIDRRTMCYLIFLISSKIIFKYIFDELVKY